jgi:hypothetical protein
MFESSLLMALQADATITALVSTFMGRPAIFSELAPETAELPYIVFRITRTSNESVAVEQFNLYIDYYDFDTTFKKSRQAAERLEHLLDRGVLEHERYGCIRLFFYSGEQIVEDDPRSIHYNMLFEARAGRKAWSADITTLGY